MEKEPSATNEREAYVKLFFAVLFWGNSFVATKIVVQEIAPSLLIGLRAFFGAAALFFVLLSGKKFVRLPAKDVFFFAVLGFFGIAFHQWLQSTAMLYTTASSGGWIIATTPVFMSVFGVIFLKEKLRFVQILGILIAAAGLLFVTSRGDYSKLDFGNFGNYGDLLMIVSAANWAVYSVFSRRKLQSNDPVLMMFYVTVFGLFFNVFQIAYEGSYAGLWSMSGKAWLSVLFLGFLCSAAAQVFWYDGLKKLQAYRTGIFLYIQPLFTVITAVLTGLEEWNYWILLGGGIILTGVWLVNKKPNKV
jgi:drug/metabolite transporter (DMT)-like permease